MPPGFLNREIVLLSPIKQGGETEVTGGEIARVAHRDHLIVVEPEHADAADHPRLHGDRDDEADGGSFNFMQYWYMLVRPHHLPLG